MKTLASIQSCCAPNSGYLTGDGDGHDAGDGDGTLNKAPRK